MSVKEDAIGKWPGIMAALGIEVGDGQHTSCPMCGGKDRFRFDDKEGRGTWFCNQCGNGDGFGLLEKKLSIPFVDVCSQIAPLLGSVPVSAILKEPAITRDKMREIFMASQRIIPGDPAYRYLRQRGLSVIPGVLRYHPNCWESETKQNQRALLAVFHDKNGQGVTMHRTYITKHGGKLDIEKPKKVLPALGKMTGGAVRLFRTEETLGIAEGIETAIAAHESMKIPVWAALNATLLESFEPPAGVKMVAIMADNDANYTGQKSAYALANRLALKGIKSTVYIPEVPGTDWLDVLNKTNEVKNGQ